jgi:hypothetical protein
MKTIYTLAVFFLIAIAARAQHDVIRQNNFGIRDQHVVYQFIFDTTVSLIDAEQYYRSLATVRSVVLKDSVLYGELDHFVVDFTRYKSHRAILPFFMARGYSSGKLRVEFRQNRYRVTLTALIANYDDPKDGQRTPYEYLLLKKEHTVFKPAVLHHDCLGILDEAFRDFLSVRAVTAERW